MYCPHCGQQQASNEMRFCSRCGFPLGVISEVLAQGGVLAGRDASGEGRKISARQKGLRQGAMLMLSTLLIVPLIVFIVLLTDSHKLIPLIPLSAVVCFIGGLLRIFYALMFEDAGLAATQTGVAAAAQSFAPPELNPPRTVGAALPPAQSRPAMDWHHSSRTAEIVQPPSVTENTTRILERKEE